MRYLFYKIQNYENSLYKILANTLFLGKEVIYLPTCHSTNDIANELVTDSLKREGTIVITDQQTKGRGQRGNVWISETQKNLTFSLILKPKFLQADRQFYLNIIVSLALVDTINSLSSQILAQVKWPNDILINKKKVAGVLIENRLGGQNISQSIIGIGLNVNEDQPTYDSATSVSKELSATFDLPQLLERLVINLEGYYLQLKEGKNEFLMNKYLENLYGYHYPVKLFSDKIFFGQIRQIDDNGRVTIVEQNNKYVFDFKGVKFILD